MFLKKHTQECCSSNRTLNKQQKGQPMCNDLNNQYQSRLILNSFWEKSGLCSSLVFIHDTPCCCEALPFPLRVRSPHVSPPPLLFSVNRSCRKGFRPCYNQRCVANSRFCDGIDDCGDNSDEAYCSSECQQPFDPSLTHTHTHAHLTHLP